MQVDECAVRVEEGRAWDDYVSRCRVYAPGQGSPHPAPLELPHLALLTVAMHDTSVTVLRAKRDCGATPATSRGGRSWPSPRLRVPGLASRIARQRPPGTPALLRRREHVRGGSPRAFDSVFPGPPDDGVAPRRYTSISGMAREAISAMSACTSREPARPPGGGRTDRRLRPGQRRATAGGAGGRFRLASPTGFVLNDPESAIDWACGCDARSGFSSTSVERSDLAGARPLGPRVRAPRARRHPRGLPAALGAHASGPA
jgi:hypothetical protein